VAVGPVEYVVLLFPGNRCTGEVGPAIADLVRAGTVRVIDLVFVGKDADGELTTYECDAREELASFADIDGEVGGLIGPDDIAYVGESLDRDSSVALVVWEDLWAAPLLEALRNANGVVVEGARIPHDLIEPALSDLADLVGAT
jgi:hypothetical protein